MMHSLNSIFSGDTNLKMSRIYLRGVDLMSLVQRYYQMEFSQLIDPLPIDPNLVQGNTEHQNIITVSNDKHQKPYRLDLSTGQYFACLGYKVYDADGNYGPLDSEQMDEYNCMYCLMPFDELSDKSEVMGIPVRRTISMILNANGQSQENIQYHMIDIFCRMRCMYAELIRRHSNKLYSHSMQFTLEIYTKYTGKDPSTLKPSSDPRLLQIYNGPMSWDEYHADSEIYPEKPGNIFYVPVIEYLGQMS